jgi:hypothetical protein
MEIKAHVDIEVVFKLNYEQAKALDAIAGYGSKEFLSVFKQHLGKEYIHPHEDGLKSLFEQIRGTGTPIQIAIHECEKFRKTINEINK